MACTSPRTVGFKADGKTLAWSQREISKEYATFQLPCGQCLQCRLDYSRQWAIRCVHEAQMHEKNSFVTLTYSDENLKSPNLVYSDFQKFMKRLRDKRWREFINKYAKDNGLDLVEAKKEWREKLSPEERKALFKPYEISVFVTGEYGDKTKRPHWHACIFNWRPDSTRIVNGKWELDAVHKYTSDDGHRVYQSATLSEHWPHGIAELGDVTFDSAAYCARYAAKKLVHGKDQDHEFKPISKKSSKQAIGKSWLEAHWRDAFNYGHIVLPNGKTSSIPRYYEKWLKQNHPTEWLSYLHRVKVERQEAAAQKVKDDLLEYQALLDSRPPLKSNPFTRNKIRRLVKEADFKRHSEKLKL